MNILRCSAILFSSIIALIAIPALSPWQLFQSMCPYFGIQSPQCAMIQQQQPSQSQQLQQAQQQIPSQQQQLCPDGSQPDATGNCPITQQQQSSQYQQAPPPSSSSTIGIP